MRSLLSILLILVLAASASAVEVVLWDFETDLGGWGGGSGTVSLGTNPVTGSQCMVISGTPAGWQTAAYNDTMGSDFVDFTATPVIQLEVTYVASEWGDVDWITQDNFIINSNGGWGQIATADAASWGAWEGDATRTVTYDYTGYDLSGGWSQLSIMINGNAPTTGSRGNYYIDNIKAIGPDPSTPWVRYECEDAVRNDFAEVLDDADCSGGQYVHITKDGDIPGTIKFYVNVREAGTYNMRYGQNSYDLERYESIYVNGVEVVSQQFAGLITWPTVDAIEGNNDWPDEATVQALYDTVELYGDEDGDWQVWSVFAEAWNQSRFNTPLTLDLNAGLNEIEIRAVWGWDDWDYIELELGEKPRNPYPTDREIVNLAEVGDLSWDNAVSGLDWIEVYFGATGDQDIIDPEDPNLVTGANYKDRLTLIYTGTTPDSSSSIAMPELTPGQHYTWVVDGQIEGDVDPNDVFYGGPFWSFYATDNELPVADAGEDQYQWFIPPATDVEVTIDGSASVDDGKDMALTYTWTQIAGPAATITDATAETTTVMLTGGLANTTEDGAAEPYEFQLEIFDGLWSDVDTVTIYVNSNSCRASIEAGSYYYYGDIASDEGSGIPDCKVDLLDFAELALNWLGCTNTFEDCN